jgi:hypothetical protein
MIRVYRAADINEAHIVAGMLRAERIDAHVEGFYLQGGIGGLAAFDFASVHVPDEEAEQARALVAEYEQSSRSHGPDRQPQGDLWVVAAVLLVVLLVTAVIAYILA